MSAAPASLSRAKQPAAPQNSTWLQPMLNGGNWAAVPLSFWTDLPRKTGGFGLQHGLIGYIWCRTAGAMPRKGEPKPELVVITMAEFALAAGTENPDGTIEPVSTRACELALEDAFNRKLIGREEVGTGYRYKALPENWSTAPPKPKRLPPKTEVVETNDSDPDLTRTPVRVTGPIVCMPGKRSKAVPLETVVRERLRSIQFESRAGEIDFASEVDGGILRISASIRAAAALSQPRDTIRPALVSAPRSPQNGHSSKVLTRTTVRVREDRFVDYKGLSDFLTPLFLQFFAKVPDAPFLVRIGDALGGATLADFQRRVKVRLKDRNGSEKTGLLLELAKDAAGCARALAEAKARDAEAEAQFKEKQRAGRIEDLAADLRGGRPLAELQWFADPDELAEARGLAEVP